VRLSSGVTNDLLTARLRAILNCGLTSSLAIEIAAQVSDRDVAGILAGDYGCGEETHSRLESLLRKYASALARVNAECLRARI